MAIVLRFVTLDDFVKERFFYLVHVTDTCATTLKKELISVLSHYNLQVENIRGQGYDGASNMRGESNGLQALFLKDSPQAYYVHCFAHRLQLALVSASREFQDLEKVNNGKEYALLNHIGKGLNSFHHKALKSCDDLMKQSQHIDRLLHKQTSEEIEKNRIRLGASIDCIIWLTFQGCAYRGHDESQSSSNRGNFLEMLKFLGSYNERVKKNVLENAPKNAKYTSNDVQKEILHILATKVRNSIREEIGDAKFCIIVDEARDKSKKEKMAIVLRFVTLDGFVKVRFFDLVHVTDTCATTLKKELISVLSHYNLQVENIRDQGYDGASNMRLQERDLGITNVLCQALQQQSQDILNAMPIVSTSKLLLQQLRDGGWCNFLANVKDFCEKHEIEVPNMSAQYVFGRGRSRQPSVTVEHHYRIDVFLAIIDSQIQELNSRFNEQTIELLTLSCALDPKDNFKSFNIEEISKLAEKFYPLDFSSNELNILKSQLQHYQHDIPNHLKGIGTLSELCNKLQETGKSRTYHMVDRLIRLVLTLPVSTATTEKAFSAMKIVKTRL
ncbi:uncharacterized protein [Arachis hypogaea]|uniref:uncharacterized protein n=1 Tax=Arachis hypogaea TaxID=3818 RepID=UPI003B221076